MTQQYFTKTEVFEDIKEYLENGYDGLYCDLHDEIFNRDDYLIGYEKAEQALETVSFMQVIREIQNFEFIDEILTIDDLLQDTEKIANKYYYIVSLNAMAEMGSAFNDNYNEYATDEINQLIIKELDKLINFGKL